jgi:hypothetical protein
VLVVYGGVVYGAYDVQVEGEVMPEKDAGAVMPHELIRDLMRLREICRVANA